MSSSQSEFAAAIDKIVADCNERLYGCRILKTN